MERQRKKHKELVQFLLTAGILAAVTAVVLVFFLTVRIVHSNEMYPAVRDGQLLLVSRVSGIRSDSIVLYRSPDGSEHFGRVMGLEDQVVEITESQGVLVNGSVILPKVPYRTEPGTVQYPYRVPEESFFVLNDYRENTEDSRSFGAVSKKDVTGVVIFALQYRSF